MKKYFVFLLVNVILFLALQLGVVLAAFLLGLASSDKYVREQWILYGFVCLLHVIIYAVIPYVRRLLSMGEFLFGALIIVLAWVITGWYMS
jgi:hypothetical protein